MNISELFDLHGRTVLITGGSGVLGRVMASGLAQAGARVAVLGRREEPVLAVAATIRAAGGEAIGVAADVLDRTALERASETITATLGPVDILINGAGGNQPQATTGPDRTFFYLEMAAIRQVFDANVTATVRASIIPAVDTLRSLGIVFISGLASGMLIAGANPIYAAEYQFATRAMLFAASTLTALIAGLLLRPTVFSPAEQLILHPSAQAQA